MQVKTIAECSGAECTLSDYPSRKPFFFLLLSGRFGQVLLYMYFRLAPCHMFMDVLTKRNNPNIVFPSELSFLSALRTYDWLNREWMSQGFLRRCKVHLLPDI